MRHYQLRGEMLASDGSVRVLKVYLFKSLQFFKAACARRGVELAVVEKDGFVMTLRGDPAKVAACQDEFDSRPF